MRHPCWGRLPGAGCRSLVVVRGAWDGRADLEASRTRAGPVGPPSSNVQRYLVTEMASLNVGGHEVSTWYAVIETAVLSPFASKVTLPMTVSRLVAKTALRTSYRSLVPALVRASSVTAAEALPYDVYVAGCVPLWAVLYSSNQVLPAPVS